MNAQELKARSYTTMLQERIQWEYADLDQGDTPKLWALARVMTALKLEMEVLEDAKENGYEIGLTKKHLNALRKINNDFVDQYNATGGDASSNYMEIE